MNLSRSVNQNEAGEIDIFWIILPILAYYIFFRRSEKPQKETKIIESWYTEHKIENIFSMIDEYVNYWRNEVEPNKTSTNSLLDKIKIFLGYRSNTTRFNVEEKNQPRLLRISDTTGSINFEFTEVSDGGTQVKISYSSSQKNRISILKSNLPIIIPANPLKFYCPTCGKSIQQDFNLCPFCGEKLEE